MDFGFDDIVNKELTPSITEELYFMFLEKGIDYHAFRKLPIPYIFSMLRVQNHRRSEEEKAYKKANRKK